MLLCFMGVGKRIFADLASPNRCLDPTGKGGSFAVSKRTRNIEKRRQRYEKNRPRILRRIRSRPVPEPDFRL